MLLQITSLDRLIKGLLPNTWSEELLDSLSIVLQLVIISIAFYYLRQFIDRTFEIIVSDKLKERLGYSSPTRIETISTMLRNAAMYLLYFLYGYMVLTLLGFPIGTLLAGAGIAGVAIGFGAQELIRDVINGFFMIFENQFEVGDLISLPGDDITGTVQKVGIRTVELKAASGEIFYIPNSEIRMINNQSRAHRQINIDIPLADDTNIKAFEAVTNRVTQALYEQNQDIIVSDPTVIGIVRGMDQTFLYRITFMVENSVQYKKSGEFYREYILQLQENNINFPSSIYDET